MKALTWFILVSSVIGACAFSAAGQSRSDARSGLDENGKSERRVSDFSSLVRGVFDPITDELKLTRDQEFRIVAIIATEEIVANPLLEKFASTDEELSQTALADSFDESRLKELAAEEARLMTEMIAMKVRAKARIYQVLTPEQRQLVYKQFRTPKVENTGNLGALSIY